MDFKPQDVVAVKLVDGRFFLFLIRAAAARLLQKSSSRLSPRTLRVYNEVRRGFALYNGVPDMLMVPISYNFV